MRTLGLGLGLGGGGAPWAPSAGEAGLVLWLRSDLGITPNGSTASAWADQSGQGNNVSQGTAGLQPTINASDAAYNNKPSLSFASASTQHLVSAALGFALTQPATYYVVGEQDGSATGGFVGTNGGTIMAAYGNATAPGTLALYAGTILSGTYQPNVPSVMGFVFNGAASSVYAMNSSTPIVTGACGASNEPSFSIGGDATVGFLQGKVVEVLAYSVAHSAADRARRFSYLARKYKLAAQ